MLGLLKFFSRKPDRIANYAPALLSEAIKRTRLLVIDDDPAEETSFPFAILKREGYAIDHWQEVQDIAKLERSFYDIIVLDIGGVGASIDPKREGLAVLEHIKKANPAQIVVAHSGQSYKSDKIPFFRLADDYVPKPTNALRWKEIIDDLIQKKVTPLHFWNSLEQMLRDQRVAPAKIESLRKAINTASSASDDEVRKIVTSTVGVVDKSLTVTSIVGKIILLFA
jgi:DNA-binding response OmpR family regulator